MIEEFTMEAFRRLDRRWKLSILILVIAFISTVFLEERWFYFIIGGALSLIAGCFILLPPKRRQEDEEL